MPKSEQQQSCPEKQSEGGEIFLSFGEDGWCRVRCENDKQDGNMTKKNLMNYTDDFIQDGKTRTEATFHGDFRSGNRAYKRMDKILNVAKGNEEAEKFYLNIFQQTDDVTVLITCCVHMLKLGIKPILARKKLEEIRDSGVVHPILSSDAKIFLQEWDKGNIKPLI